MWRLSADQPVVQGGPYRLVRHPAYSGTFLTMLGVGPGAEQLGRPGGLAACVLPRPFLPGQSGGAGAGPGHRPALCRLYAAHQALYSLVVLDLSPGHGSRNRDACLGIPLEQASPTPDGCLAAYAHRPTQCRPSWGSAFARSRRPPLAWMPAPRWKRCSPIRFSSSAWAPTGTRSNPNRAHSIPGELDWQIDAAESAGKQIILCLGPLKTFGYPEFFAPAAPFEAALPGAHADQAVRLPGPPGRRDRLSHPPGGALPGARKYHRLAARARSRGPAGRGAFVAAGRRLCRSQKRGPLRDGGPGPAAADERLSANLLACAPLAMVETPAIKAIRWRSPSGWPIGSGSMITRATRWCAWGPRPSTWTAAGAAWQRRRRQAASARYGAQRRAAKRLLVTEGQAEPWETATTPPSPQARACTVVCQNTSITNYNAWLGEVDAPGLAVRLPFLGRRVLAAAQARRGQQLSSGFWADP